MTNREVVVSRPSFVNLRFVHILPKFTMFCFEMAANIVPTVWSRILELIRRKCVERFSHDFFTINTNMHMTSTDQSETFPIGLEKWRPQQNFGTTV